MRAIGLVVATVLTGMPVMATACEWACAHDAVTGHEHHGSHASSIDHSHHGPAAAATDSETRFAAAVATERDCCDDVSISAKSVRTGRIDTSISPTFDSFATAETRLHLRPATATCLNHSAPPGSSPQTARSLPLRI